MKLSQIERLERFAATNWDPEINAWIEIYHDNSRLYEVKKYDTGKATYSILNKTDNKPAFANFKPVDTRIDAMALVLRQRRLFKRVLDRVRAERLNRSAIFLISSKNGAVTGTPRHRGPHWHNYTNGSDNRAPEKPRRLVFFSVFEGEWAARKLPTSVVFTFGFLGSNVYMCRHERDNRFKILAKVSENCSAAIFFNEYPKS